MPSINDWAAKAARRIADEPNGRRYEDRVAAIIATFTEPIVKLLRESRREHYHCDDSWYCCPMCLNDDHGRRGGAQDDNGECRCGADAWNARVEEVLK